MNKKVAILQPFYLPWKGVFDMINQVDTFVLLDDVSFSKGTWQNRNYIKAQNGNVLLTIPTKKVPLLTNIKDVKIADHRNWIKTHHQNIIRAYKKAPFFEDYKWILDELYVNNQWENLSDLTIKSMMLLIKALGITTEIIKSSELHSTGIKDDKVIDIIKKVDGDFYLSGPGSKSYIKNEKFKENNITLAYINYDYPTYKQLHNGEFEHEISVLDILFTYGKDSHKYIFINNHTIVDM